MDRIGSNLVDGSAPGMGPGARIGKTAAMIVAIDGPAGAGKSSVARILARRLGFRFLDTGAMYRTVALAALERDIPLNDQPAVADLAARLSMELDDDRVFLDGRDVTTEIRAARVTAHVHYVADNDAVRRHLIARQRSAVIGGRIVTEGRDQGTLAFPDSPCKIFLTATPLERARRRLQELQARGETTSLTEVLQQQEERDQRDALREFGRLEKAADAVEVATDGLTSEQVVDRLEAIVRGSDRRAAEAAGC